MADVLRHQLPVADAAAETLGCCVQRPQNAASQHQWGQFVFPAGSKAWVPQLAALVSRQLQPEATNLVRFP
jgi:hypothetical protein